MPRCQASKPDGSSCERIVGSSAVYCYSHDPARQAQRSAAASTAAKAKGPQGEIVEVKAQLRTLMDGVLDNSIERGKASVCATVAGVLAKFIELERRVKETEKLEAEVEELKRHVQGGYRWGS